MNIVTDLIAEVNASAPAEKSIQDLIRESLIPQGIEVPRPDTVFGLNGKQIFTKKSISTLTGKAKVGKTTVTSWIVAESIKSDISVLWADTEQGLYYGSLTQYRVLNIAGLPHSELLQFYDLKIYSPPDRISIIEEIIKLFKPDLVIVDGIRDLVFDINSPDEATKRVGDLMRWAEIYDCHIMTILHQNKGNEHARGHLGTEMINKSETVLKVELNEDRLIVCSPEYTRGAPFDAFAFDRDENGLPFIVEGYSGKVEVTRDSNSVRKGPDPWDPAFDLVYPQMVEFIFKLKEYLSYSQFYGRVQDYFKANGSSVGIVKAKEFVRRLNDIGITWENEHIKGREKYHRNPKYVAPVDGPIKMPMNLNLEGILSTKQEDEDDTPF